jgi:branched-chain amino acid transport system permease protein
MLDETALPKVAKCLESIKGTTTKTVMYVGLIVLILLVPWLTPNDYVLRIVITILLYVVLALGQQLLTGFTGILSLGHAGFYGLGAYTSALLVLNFGVPWPLALLSAAVLACVFGVALGFPCLRVGGDYLTLMTIGFGEIARIVFLRWIPVTRGPMGLPNIPSPQIGPFVFDTNIHYYYLYLCLAAFTYFCIRRVVNSEIGRSLMAIRDDEIAAMTVGIDIARYKVMAFGISTFFAGMAGSMLAHFLRFIGPMNFTMDESLLMMQMVILGGLGSLPGTILGSAILVVTPEIFRVLTDYRQMLNGALMVVLMILRPQGLMGTLGASTALRISLGGIWPFSKKREQAEE